MKNRWLLVLLILSSAALPAAYAAWETADEGERAVASVSNEHGQHLDLFVDERNAIFLRITLGQGFEAFAAASCPTFQIDERKPMHHFVPGPNCTVASKNVTFSLGEIVDRGIRSLVVHRLLNGNAVTFRYTVSNGQYRQARFSLSRSKQAMRKLLGYTLNVEVDQPDQ
ncbi:MAG: hypothetical protein ACU85U_17300 [Gammaproteobacteria bacterium]